MSGDHQELDKPVRPKSESPLLKEILNNKNFHKVLAVYGTLS